MRELKKKLNAKKIPEMKPKLTETQERTVTTDNSVREMEEEQEEYLNTNRE